MLQVIEWQKRNPQYVFFVLPPHTSHATHPLDRRCFAQLKHYYDVEADKWLKENPGQIIGLDNIAHVISIACPEGFKFTTVQSAFKSCGVYPLDRSRIKEWETAPAKPKQLAKTPITRKQMSDVRDLLNNKLPEMEDVERPMPTMGTLDISGSYLTLPYCCFQGPIVNEIMNCVCENKKSNNFYVI